MSTTIVPAGAQEMKISLVVHRADGTVEDLGVVSYWHKNPLKRLWFKASQIIKGH